MGDFFYFLFNFIYGFIFGRIWRLLTSGLNPFIDYPL